MHLILTGATGTVGSSVLHHCLHSPSISKLSILSRREIELAKGHEKANVIIHKDYTSYPPDLLEKLKGAQACIWAQGISQLSVTKDEYLKITYDYPMAAAKAFSTLSDRMVFVYVSGEGADQTEKSGRLFAKIKGRCEKDLITLSTSTPSLKIYNPRPAMVDPTKEPVFPDRKPQWIEKAIPFLRAVLPSSMHSPSGKLAEALEKLALSDGAPFPAGPGVEPDGRTLGNKALRQLAGLS